MTSCFPFRLRVVQGAPGEPPLFDPEPPFPLKLPSIDEREDKEGEGEFLDKDMAEGTEDEEEAAAAAAAAAKLWGTLLTIGWSTLSNVVAGCHCCKNRMA